MRLAWHPEGVAARLVLVVALASMVPSATARGEAPDFAAHDLDGAPRQLAELRGPVTVVAFWATWCFPCRYELPLLERLYRTRGPRGLQVVAVASDDTLEAVRAYVAEKGFTFPVLFDGQGVARERFGAGALPATVLLDARGRPVALEDPVTGAVSELLDNPLIWSDPGTLQRIDALLGAALEGS